MKSPTFVLDSRWERRRAVRPLAPEAVTPLLARGGYQGQLVSVEPVGQGLANENYRLDFADNHEPLLLRRWTRDPDACQKEYLLHQKVKDLGLPVPDFLYAEWVGPEETPWALLSWVDGQLMTKVILEESPEQWLTLFTEAAALLGRISAVSFPAAGHLSPSLDVRPLSATDCFAYLEECLESTFVAQALGPGDHGRVRAFINNQRSTLAAMTSQCNLVHGDYKTANLLVRRDGRQYRLAAVLDWEFAFAGPSLFDIATLTRFENELGPAMVAAVEEGLCRAGLELPADWPLQCKVFDLFNLLEFLRRPQVTHGQLVRHCTALVRYTLDAYGAAARKWPGHAPS